MKIEDFIETAWKDHATEADAVATRLTQALSLVTSEEQIPPLATLIVHVFAEHLGRWEEGIRLLQSLRAVRPVAEGSEADRALKRSAAAVRVAGGETLADDFSTSDRVRVFSVAAAALTGQKQIARAQREFRKALELAQSGLAKDDPANRALAVAANNLACELEEFSLRTDAESQFMILAAETARKFWEISGGWKQILWAEYRLAMTFNQAKDFQKALVHAQACVEIAEQNQAPALEMFYSYEAIAVVESSRENAVGHAKAVERAEDFYRQLAADDQKWCAASRERYLARL